MTRANKLPLTNDGGGPEGPPPSFLEPRAA